MAKDYNFIQKALLRGNEMNIKLEDIRDQHPCESGWKKLIRSLDGRTEGDVSLSHILDSNGIEDAVWCLRVLPYREQCLFRADVAELVVHLCDDPRPKQAIAAIRQWHSGEIGDKSLTDAAYAAYTASRDYASYATAAATGLSNAVAVAEAATAAAAAAAYAAYADAYAAAATAVSDTWLKITELFKMHFCEEIK